MIAALEPLHEEMERVSSLGKRLSNGCLLVHFRDPRLREKRRSSKHLVVSSMRREKRLVDTRNMAKSKILITRGISILR